MFFDPLRMKPLNGMAILVSIYREMNGVDRQKMLMRLEKASPALGKLLDRCTFLFEDLVRLDDTSQQKLLSHIPEEDLLKIWKDVSEPMRKSLMRNMSARRREDFLAALKGVGKISKSQSIYIQLRVAKWVQNKLAEGALGVRSRRS